MELGRHTLIGSVACLLGVLALGLLAQGQPSPTEVRPTLRPVIAESRRDGLLLGLDLRLDLAAWEVQVGGAYGVASRSTRFRTGLSYRQVLELSYGDWPHSLVQGREGEEGARLAADLVALYRWLGGREAGLLGEILQKSELRGTGFAGRLWPGAGEAEGPSVRYLHLSSFIRWPLPLGVDLETQGEFLLGQPVEAPQSFRTFFSSTSLQVGQTRLSFQMGSLDNPANLPGFHFDLGLRSYPKASAGDRFVLASLERQFEALSAHLFRLDLGPLGSIPVRLRVVFSAFFEGGMTLGGERTDRPLFGWGVSLILPDLASRVDLAINREGSPRLVLETGVLP